MVLTVIVFAAFTNVEADIGVFVGIAVAAALYGHAALRCRRYA